MPDSLPLPSIRFFGAIAALLAFAIPDRCFLREVAHRVAIAVLMFVVFCEMKRHKASHGKWCNDSNPDRVKLLARL